MCRNRPPFFLPLALFLLAGIAPAASGVLSPRCAAAEEAPSPARARADAAIRWKLPHEFEVAVAEAKARKRLLVIKGVSFGIDQAGAMCATKGKW